MRYLINTLIVLGCILMSACQEDDIKPDLSYYQDFWVIKDNPDDSIQHRVYQIYEKYGVSTFFNDTLGKTFVAQDIHGDSVFQYETIDLNWSFSSENYATPYVHQYLTTPQEKMHGLKIVEEYLEKVPKSIYPYSIFLTKKTNKKDMDGWSSVEKGIFFRTLLLSNITKQTTQKKIDSYVAKVMNSVLLNKLSDDVIAAFGAVSDHDTYEKKWSELESNLPEDFDPDILYDSEASEEAKKAVRDVLGKYGFVSSYANSDFDLDIFDFIYFDTTPPYEEKDLQDFIKEIISITSDEFVRRWGSYPLVMQKYDLLKKYIPAAEK